MAETILIIDDDPDWLCMISLALQETGYCVCAASTGAEGLRLLREQQPDLALLDAMLPDTDGWQLCEDIRAISTIPIILFSARQSEQDKVRGLELGADDYIVKPCTLAELRARVAAALRRSHMPPPPKQPILRFHAGELVINTAMRAVLVRGDQVEMTPTEYRLLLYLAERPGRLLTTEQIYEAVWSMETDAMLTNVKWYIWRLRGKIECDRHHPRFILTEPGVGYRFSAG